MKTKIAGVALAAAMACGWASGARASTMATIDFDVAILGSVYSGSVDLTFDNGAGSVSNLSLVINGFDYGQYQYTAISENNPLNGSLVGYEFDQVNQSGKPNGFVVVTDPSYPFKGLFSFPDTGLVCASCTTVTSVSGTLLPINPVPLPASAPLFGAALIGLGAIGWSSRRRVATQAA